MGMDGADPQRAAHSLDAAELEAARLGFHRANPRRSAKRPIYITQWIAFGALVAAFVWSTRTAPLLTWTVVHYSARRHFDTLVSIEGIARHLRRNAGAAIVLSGWVSHALTS